MGNFVYGLLELAGYGHPLHPVIVHVPAGMTIGALCFALWARLTGQSFYRKTAYSIIVVCCIFAVFAIALGIIDWQRFYGGALIFEIKAKLLLACLYFVLVCSMLLIGARQADSKLMLPLYFCSTLMVGGLGFFGGQLVYHGFTPDAPEKFASGQQAFESHCSGCHRRGENIIVPTLPLRNAPQLKNYSQFLDFIRNPKMPDGSSGLMPRFSVDKLSDEQAKQLHEYLYFTFLAQNRVEARQ